MAKPRKPGETDEQFKLRMKEVARLGGKSRKGTKNKTTIDREEMFKEMKDTVARRTRALLNAQSILAMGSIKIFRIDYEMVGSGKKQWKKAKKPVIVESEEEIISVLDYEYGDGETPNDDTTFYFVMTKDPDNQAIKDMLDRTYGKPVESVKHSGTVGFSLKSLLKEAKGDEK